MKQFIPFTEERRNRLYGMSLQKKLGDSEVLMQIEWPDGTITYEPANWQPETSCWITQRNKRFYQKGKGRTTYSLMGVPVVPVAGENAGVVAAEAALVASQELEDEYVDANGRPLEVVETDSNGDPRYMVYADTPAASDGGAMEVGKDITLHYKVDGRTISRTDAGLIDPFPVSRQEADQAIEHAIAATTDTAESMKMFFYGLGAGLGIILLFIFFIWLLGQIGGGDGGSIILLFIGGWF